MAELQDKSTRLHKAIKDSVVVQKAIKAALAPYRRQQYSEPVVKAVDATIETPARQIRITYSFLKYAESYRPRVPSSLLSLPVPEKEVPSKPVVCKCHHNLLCKMHFYGKEMLYLDSEESSKQVDCPELSPLKVLFGYMGVEDVDFDSVDL